MMTEWFDRLQRESSNTPYLTFLLTIAASRHGGRPRKLSLRTTLPDRREQCVDKASNDPSDFTL